MSDSSSIIYLADEILLIINILTVIHSCHLISSILKRLFSIPVAEYKVTPFIKTAAEPVLSVRHITLFSNGIDAY